MKSAVKAISIINLLFVVLLMISGFFSGAVGEILYYASFLIPLLLFFGTGKRLGIRMNTLKFGINADSLVKTLLISSPTVLLLASVSLLTTYLFSFFGIHLSSPDTSESLYLLIVRYALLPALLEEMLFRYVPLSLMAPYSKRDSILLSAIFFALIHCSFLQIPHSLLAGLIFGTLAILTGSILPSFILHFLNNTISLILMKYGGVQSFYITFISSLVAVSLVCVFAFVLAFGKRTFGEIKAVFQDKSNLLFTSSTFAFILTTVFLSIVDIL